MGAFLLVLLVMVGAMFALTWGVLRALEHWAHGYVALGVGLCAIAFFVQDIWRGIAFCARDPVIVPPAPGEAGEGRVVANCDGPGGMLDRIYLYFVGPALVAFLIWMGMGILKRLETKSQKGAME